MKLRRKIVWRLIWITGVLILAAGLIVPSLNADRYAGRLRDSLRQALGREVDVLGKVRLDLFGGPGFTVERVVIHDDAAAGIEPFAYVESLEARVSFASLWTGLRISSLRLNNPSVNLVRPEGGQWNLVPLLGRTAAAPARVRLPEIQVRGGRINFKLGDRKSIFYLGDVSLDAAPPASPDGDWSLRFQGAPARTDRAAQRYGSFRARGRWRRDAAAGGYVDLALDLERSSLGELIRLVHGHDIGLHGQVTSRAQLRGPVADIGIQGKLELSDVHRWDLLPPYSGYWPFEYKGRLDLVSQTLDIDTVGGQPAQFALRASGFLSRPAWGATAKLRAVPLPEAAALARQMGLAVPPELQTSGEVTGVIGYAPASGLAGMVAATNLSVNAPGAPEVRMPRGEFVIAGANVRLMPSGLRLAAAPAGNLEGEFSWADGSLDLVATARAASIPETAAAARLIGGAPVLERCAKGEWTGLLRYRKRSPEAAGQWSGMIEVRNAAVDIEGLADAAILSSARVAFRQPGVVVDRMSGHAGTAAFQGQYRYEEGLVRPHRLRLSITADAAELERLLAPTLRRDEGFLTRALRFGRARVPEWLDERRAAVVFDVTGLSLNGAPLEKLHGRMLWNGSRIEIGELTASLAGARLAGDLSADLRGPAPAYRFRGTLAGLEWAGGEWNWSGVMDTWGTGPEVLRNVRVQAGFAGRSVALAGDTRFSSVTGRCALSAPRGVPVLRITQLQATAGDDRFEGQGGSGADGRVTLELTAGEKDLHLSGTLWPLKLESKP